METKKNVKEIVDQLCERKGELEIFTKCIQELNSLVPSLEELKGINPKLLVQKEEIQNLEKQKMSLEKEYNQKQAKCETLREQVPVLQVELARINAEKSELKRILKTNKKELAELEPKDLEELKAQMIHLKERIKYINNSKTQKDYYLRIIEDLEQEISS